jgi:glycine oxidase
VSGGSGTPGWSGGDEAVDVAVVGGGIIGLAIAWRAAEAGLTVAVLDPTPRRGASWVAAGMLAPVTEVHYGEEELLALNLASAERWPSFAAELEEASGLPAGFDAGGTLVVAYDRDDREALAALTAYQASLGLDVERLTSRQARQREPMVAAGIAAAASAPHDHRVDPRAATAALWAATERAGVRHVAERVVRIDTNAQSGGGTRVTGVTTASGTQLEASTVVVAAAWESPSLLATVPGAPTVPVRPVKGQLLVLRAHEGGSRPTANGAAAVGDAGPRPAAGVDIGPLLHGSVRALVEGSHVYLVPRRDGRLIVGATVEEQGSDRSVTAGGVYQLLRDASLVVPGISELELLEAIAGLRPATPDNAPVLGPSEQGPAGLVLATGHFRNGILLSAITADIITELLVDGAVPALARPFSPHRFTRSPDRLPHADRLAHASRHSSCAPSAISPERR